jgi:hypothetical protein
VTVDVALSGVEKVSTAKIQIRRHIFLVGWKGRFSHGEGWFLGRGWLWLWWSGVDWGRGGSIMLCLFAFLEQIRKIDGFVGKDQATEIVVLTFYRHAAPHAGTHSRNRGTAIAVFAASATPADAETSFCPFRVEFFLVCRWRGRSNDIGRQAAAKLETAREVRSRLEIIAPVVSDILL